VSAVRQFAVGSRVRQFAAAFGAAIALAALAPSPAWAGGFELQEQSARGTAMSGA